MTRVALGNVLVCEVALRNQERVPTSAGMPEEKTEIEFQESVRSKMEFWNEPVTRK